MFFPISDEVTYKHPLMLVRSPSVRPLSVPWAVAISRKLCKIDPQLRGSWRAPLILLPDSDPPIDAPLGVISISDKIRANINTASRSTWRQTTAAVNRARPSSTVVHEVRRSDLLITIMVRCVDDARMRASFYLQCEILVSVVKAGPEKSAM